MQFLSLRKISSTHQTFFIFIVQKKSLTETETRKGEKTKEKTFLTINQSPVIYVELNKNRTKKKKTVSLLMFCNNIKRYFYVQTQALIMKVYLLSISTFCSLGVSVVVFIGFGRLLPERASSPLSLRFVVAAA